MEHVNAHGVIEDESALVAAAQEGYRPRIESLLAAGADVNEVNGAGETATMKAAEARNSRCLQLLVDAGADVNARDCNGVTAFLKAAWAYNVECMSILLKAGADVNYLSEDCCGRAITALMDAAETNHPECVKFLIETGADVNKITLRSYGGTSALTFAARSGSYKCLDLLAAAGADVTDSSTPNSQVIEAFSLCMFLFCTFYQTLPSGPLALNSRGTGSKLVTRSGVFEIPVAE